MAVKKSSPYYFIILMGLVSLFADMTYEGARSTIGPFLQILGASGLVVSMVAGFGEFVSVTLRMLFGYWSDKTRWYWGFTFLGYALNLFAVPLLALAGQWEVAVALVIAERLGKAIRAPARDVLLSGATRSVGSGWGFGLHEAMDQIGAVAGPLLLAGILFVHDTYRQGYAVLLIPALIAFSLLVVGRVLFPRPQEFETQKVSATANQLPFTFKQFLFAAVFLGAGFVDFPLVAYHLKASAVIAEAWIPVVYAVAMGVDAVAALGLGRWYDRSGIQVMAFAALFSAIAPLFLFGFSAQWVVAGIVLWGIAMGARESILKAVVSDLVPAERRGTAFGLFNGIFGLAWFAGSALIGWLYETQLAVMLSVVVVLQVISAGAFWHLHRKARASF